MGFVVFEGIDGSGKSSLIVSLSKDLKKRGLNLNLTKEPGGTVLGQKIRKLLIEHTPHPPTAQAENLLYFADRSQHIKEVIEPTLKKGEWLISDRYWASTFAYQCGGRQINEKFVSSLHKLLCPPECEPDLWILLDLPVEVSLQRMEKERKNQRDRFELEERDFHQRVRDYYLKIAQSNPKNWLVVDACQAPEQILKKIIKDLENRNLLDKK